MGMVHELIRKGIDRLEREGLNQTQIAHRCKLSQPTINKYIKYEPAPDRATLQKFSAGLSIPMDALIAAETPGSYTEGSPSAPLSVPPGIAELVDLARQLDHDELSTLKRCAEAFTRSTPAVRQHLIGQLKLVEELVQYQQADPPSKKTRESA